MSDALTRYLPSGKVAVLRFVPALVVGCGIAVLAGLGYQWLVTANAFVMLNPLLPLVLGGVCAVSSVGVARFGHVRRATVVHAVSSIIACAALGAAWAVHAPEVERAVLPSGRCFAVFEGVAVVGLSLAAARSWWRRAVFDEVEKRWLARRRIGKAYGSELLSVRRNAGENGVEALFTPHVRPSPSSEHEGEFRFWLQAGSGGRWLTLTWHGQLEGLRGKRVRRDVLVLRRVEVDEAFVDEVRSRFGQARE